VSANTDAAPAGANIGFTVFVDGVVAADFVVPTNASGFASSALAASPDDNLFAASGGAPALVRTRTPSGSTTHGAVLRQTSKSRS
jgi:hypothetical protein